jgi:hypothetical protein
MAHVVDKCGDDFGDVLCDQPKGHDGHHSGIPARVFWMQTQTKKQLCGAIGPNRKPCVLEHGHKPRVHYAGDDCHNWQIVDGKIDY